MAKGKRAQQPSAPDVVATQATQKLLHDTFGAKNGVVPPVVAPENATVFVAMNDYRLATEASGPLLIRRGQEITSKLLIHMLKEIGADIRPVR